MSQSLCICLFVFYSDMDLDDESSPERKREIKKAVGPSKKREAAKTRSGVIKAQRLSEPDRSYWHLIW